MSGEMGLVGKACTESGIRQAPVFEEQMFRPVEPAHDEVAVRACPQELPEMPRGRVTVEAADGLQFPGGDGTVAIVLEIVAATKHRVARDRLARRGAWRAAMGVRVTPEACRQPGDQVIQQKLLRCGVKIIERLGEAVAEGIVCHDRLGHEGQSGHTARRLDQPFRRQVEHSVTQTVVGAGGAVMHLVRMQDDDIAGQADADGAAIMERLDAGKRDSERIGVMPVRRKAIAVEPRLDPLDAA